MKEAEQSSDADAGGRDEPPVSREAFISAAAAVFGWDAEYAGRVYDASDEDIAAALVQWDRG